MKDKKSGNSICVQCQKKLAAAIVSGAKLDESENGYCSIEIDGNIFNVLTDDNLLVLQENKPATQNEVKQDPKTQGEQKKEPETKPIQEQRKEDLNNQHLYQEQRKEASNNQQYERSFS